MASRCLSLAWGHRCLCVRVRRWRYAPTRWLGSAGRDKRKQQPPARVHGASPVIGSMLEAEDAFAAIAREGEEVCRCRCVGRRRIVSQTVAREQWRGSRRKTKRRVPGTPHEGHGVCRLQHLLTAEVARGDGAVRAEVQVHRSRCCCWRGVCAYASTTPALEDETGRAVQSARRSLPLKRHDMCRHGGPPAGFGMNALSSGLGLRMLEALGSMASNRASGRQQTRQFQTKERAHEHPRSVLFCGTPLALLRGTPGRST